jgi:hypothetical protein
MKMKKRLIKEMINDCERSPIMSVCDSKDYKYKQWRLISIVLSKRGEISRFARHTKTRRSNIHLLTINRLKENTKTKYTVYFNYFLWVNLTKEQIFWESIIMENWDIYPIKQVKYETKN